MLRKTIEMLGNVELQLDKLYEVELGEYNLWNDFESTGKKFIGKLVQVENTLLVFDESTKFNSIIRREFSCDIYNIKLVESGEMRV